MMEGRLTLSHSRYQSDTEAEFLATEFAVRNRLDTSLAGRLDWRAARSIGYSWGELLVVRLRLPADLQPRHPVDYGSQARGTRAFAEDHWFVDDLTTVRAGLRYRYLTDGPPLPVEPRLSFSRQLRPTCA